METHRLLTFVAAVLLVATFLIDHNHESGFNYAYATGIAMLAVLVAGFAIFTMQKMKRGFAS